MGKRLDLAQVRDLTEEERQQVKRLAHSRTAPARAVERARVVQAALAGEQAHHRPDVVGHKDGQDEACHEYAV